MPEVTDVIAQGRGGCGSLQPTITENSGEAQSHHKKQLPFSGSQEAEGGGRGNRKIGKEGRRKKGV